MVSFKNLAVIATALFSCALGAPIEERAGQTISGKYIVTLKPGVKAQDFDKHINWINGIQERSIDKRDAKGVERTYNGKYNFRGYAGSFDDKTIEEIKASPDVSLTGVPPNLQTLTIISRLKLLSWTRSGLSAGFRSQLSPPLLRRRP